MGAGRDLDGLARDLASGQISRRAALARLAGAAVGVGLAAIPGGSALGSRRTKRCPSSRRCGDKCCPKHARCKHGKCKCDSGYTKCGKKCFDLETNPAHCGDCATQCAAGVECVGGRCIECATHDDCPGNGECQDGTCVPPVCNDGLLNGQETDIDCGGPECQPCGAGKTCTVGTDCASGVCCGGTCRATQTDVNNCGGCGNVCSGAHATTTTCVSGTCSHVCAAGYADCNANVAPNLDGCETALNTTANCGACGNVCSEAHATSTTCNGTKCVHVCAAGYGDCNSNIAPNTDGCETPLNTTVNCGACGAQCSLIHATSTTCASGTCTFTCSAGYVNCNGGGADGCECEGNGCCTAGTCQTKHSNGVGQFYYDCVAADTYNQTQAMAACAASGSQTCTASTCQGSGAGVVCSNGGAMPCKCWQYNGTAAGHVSSACVCPSTGDPAWH